MNHDTLKGICYGIAGSFVCMMIAGADAPRTGVNTTTGEPIILFQEKQEKNPFEAVGSIGRYQLSSWSSNWGDGGGYGAFVIDSTTGKTKIAYSYFFRQGKESVTVNNLDKPFGSITR